MVVKRLNTERGLKTFANCSVGSSTSSRLQFRLRSGERWMASRPGPRPSSVTSRAEAMVVPGGVSASNWRQVTSDQRWNVITWHAARCAECGNNAL